MYSRRDFGKLTLAGIPAALLAQKKINSVVSGVQLGAQTYSFRTFPLDGMIQAMMTVGSGRLVKSTRRMSSPMSGREELVASGGSPFRSTR